MSDQPEKPEGWEREGEEIRQRYDWAEAMGGEEAVRLRHEKGFLTVRERIAGIADPDSFQEVGKLTGKGQYDEQGRIIKVSPAPYVMGIAEVDGRPVAIGGEDTTVRGGTSWGHGRRKGGQGGFIDDLAYHYRIPLIRLIDGYGGGVASAKRGFTVFPGHTNDPGVNVAELLGVVPVVSAVLGIAAGGPAQPPVGEPERRDGHEAPEGAAQLEGVRQREDRRLEHDGGPRAEALQGAGDGAAVEEFLGEGREEGGVEQH